MDPALFLKLTANFTPLSTTDVVVIKLPEKQIDSGKFLGNGFQPSVLNYGTDDGITQNFLPFEDILYFRLDRISPAEGDKLKTITVFLP